MDCRDPSLTAYPLMHKFGGEDTGHWPIFGLPYTSGDIHLLKRTGLEERSAFVSDHIDVGTACAHGACLCDPCPSLR